MIFKRGPQGFPYVDMDEQQDAIMMVNTVRRNVKGYSTRQAQAAQEAYTAQSRTANQSERDFNLMVRTGSLRNCPVTPKALSDAKDIFGPHLPGVRGKTVRQPPTRVNTDTVSIPRDFQRLHKSVTLVADVFFVNEIPFLITLSDISCYASS